MARSNGSEHPNSRFITGIDGKTIEVHPYYNLLPLIWNNPPPTKGKRITQEPRDYRSAKRQKVSEIGPTMCRMSKTSSGANTVISNVSTNDTVTSTPNSIMGGRNNQHYLRSRNQNSSGN